MTIRTAALATPFLLALSAPTQGCSSARTHQEEQAHIVKTMAPLNATTSRIIEGCKSVLAAEDVKLSEPRLETRDLKSPFNFNSTSVSEGKCTRLLRKGSLDDEEQDTWVTYTSPEGKRWTMVLSVVNSLGVFPPGDVLSHASCERVYYNYDREFIYSYKEEGAISSKYMYLENGDPCLSTGEKVKDGLRDLRWTVSDLKK